MRLRLDRALVLAVPWAWLLLFLAAPAAIMLGIAFSEPRDGVPPYAPPLQADPAGTWRLHVVPDSFALLFEDALYVRALLLSLQVAGVSTLGCLLIGYPMALAIARAPPRLRSLLLLLVVLPFWTGFLLRINAWIGLLKDDGWINAALLALGLVHAPLRLLYTDFAMYVGIVYAYLPFMLLPLYARLSRQDPALAGGGGGSRGIPLAGVPGRDPAAFYAGRLGRHGARVHSGSRRIRHPRTARRPARTDDRPRDLDGFFQNRDWPQAAAVATVLVILLLLPAAVAQHRQGRTE